MVVVREWRASQIGTVSAVETRTTTVSAPDGRILCVESGGDSAGRPVLVHGGTPDSRHLANPWLEDAAKRGVHLISYDRPGYGGSTPRPGRSVADCADDVRAIADAFGVVRLAVWGWSGGGPHALACAALLPDLVSAVGSLASPAPYGAPGLDYFSGMGQDNVEDIQLLLKDPTAARQKSLQDRDEAMAREPDTLFESWSSLLSSADAAALTHDFASYIVTCCKAGLAAGDQGWWDDGCAHLAPWGFSLDAIRMPVQLWHGAQDRFVPYQHGQWLAQHIPDVDAHLTESDGHLTLAINRVSELHEWLLRHP
jgi:pimeloyl-ACP methyl ester carboxylesterase